MSTTDNLHIHAILDRCVMDGKLKYLARIYSNGRPYMDKWFEGECLEEVAAMIAACEEKRQRAIAQRTFLVIFSENGDQDGEHLS